MNNFTYNFIRYAGELARISLVQLGTGKLSLQLFLLFALQ